MNLQLGTCQIERPIIATTCFSCEPCAVSNLSAPDIARHGFMIGLEVDRFLKTARNRATCEEEVPEVGVAGLILLLPVKGSAVYIYVYHNLQMSHGFVSRARDLDAARRKRYRVESWYPEVTTAAGGSETRRRISKSLFEMDAKLEK